VLLVDDWIATGAQAHAVERLVGDAEASFIGASVIVDATTAAVRRDLNVRSLVFVRQLPD
jgi:adenine phosphoribosyltransferase